MASESTVQRIFDDLLNLEVDLILKADMTARKMPLTGEAFADVAASYHAYLHQLADRFGAQHPQPVSEGVNAAVFATLGRVAKQLGALQRAAHGEGSAEEVVLKRIERNSQQLAGILTRLQLGSMKTAQGWVPLTAAKKEELLILRKAWEVSTETVIMQTVAQVDGDIVTRLQPAYADSDHAPVHAVHARLVTTALEQWRFMFATVATLTISTFQSFF